MLQTASVAPYAKHSPQPTSPSSVATRTRICRASPGAHDDGGMADASGIASGIARTSVIFILSRSVDLTRWKCGDLCNQRPKNERSRGPYVDCEDGRHRNVGLQINRD